MSIAEWTDVHGIHHQAIFRSSYRKLNWLGFEPTTTEFCSLNSELHCLGRLCVIKMSLRYTILLDGPILRRPNLVTIYDTSDKYSECYGIATRSYMLEEYLDKRLFESFKYVQICLILNLYTWKKFHFPGNGSYVTETLAVFFASFFNLHVYLSV